MVKQGEQIMRFNPIPGPHFADLLCRRGERHPDPPLPLPSLEQQRQILLGDGRPAVGLAEVQRGVLNGLDVGGASLAPGPLKDAAA